MRPNLTVVTLGVKDFRRSLRFYKDGLGWATAATEKDPVAFFDLGGVVLALFPSDELAKDAGVPAEGKGFRSFSLAHNAKSEREVDAVFRTVEALGAKIVKKPGKVFWGGYSGYFAEP